MGSGASSEASLPSERQKSQGQGLTLGVNESQIFTEKSTPETPGKLEGAPLAPALTISSSTSFSMSGNRGRIGKDRKSLKSFYVADEGDANGPVVVLPRGGVHVTTRLGAIQFGMPPETIKDALNLGLDVPHYYVIPKQRFNLQQGLSVAEFEFPAFFNFFVKQSSVELICRTDVKPLIQKVVHEVWDGPGPENLHSDEEYGRFCSPEVYAGRPDLRKELDYFIEPRGGRILNAESWVQYRVFERPPGTVWPTARLDGETKDGHKVTLLVVDKGETYEIIENGTNMAVVPDHVQLPQPTDFVEAQPGIGDRERSLSYAGRMPMQREEDETGENGRNAYQVQEETKRVQEETKRSSNDELRPGNVVSHSSALSGGSDKSFKHSMSPETFMVPKFGVTMLGSSHGFDSKGTTTGFIIWIHGKGIAVDPPPHCDSYLAVSGVSPRLITGIILTHCHADHDAGTFQKILHERTVEVFTTRTIMDSFIRKYAIISGLDETLLRGLFDFKPVPIHESIRWQGAELTFFYALHALPCIGFKVVCGGKSLVYSGDTFNDAEGLSKLVERGIISKERKAALEAFPWDCDIVLHECGVPPIHTPAKTLLDQPPEVQKNLYAVHISNEAAEKAGLRIAKAGFENTLRLHVETPPDIAAIAKLQLAANTTVFQDASIHQAVEILQNCVVRELPQGHQWSGLVGGFFIIIASGVLRITGKSSSGEAKEIVLCEGDYIGEISGWTGEEEEATLEAATPVTLLEFDKFVFNQYLDACASASNRLEILKQNRNQGFAKIMKHNSVLRNLSFTQRTHLQSMLTRREVTTNDLLWAKGDPVTEMAMVIIVAEGMLAIDEFDITESMRDMQQDPYSNRLHRRGSAHARPRPLPPNQFDVGKRPPLQRGAFIIPGIIAQSADRQARHDRNGDDLSIRQWE